MQQEYPTKLGIELKEMRLTPDIISAGSSDIASYAINSFQQEIVIMGASAGG
ncbi:MAG TPA: hypothetical protein VF172_04935 [Nitrososphaera sp.]|jgi:hypothetical protein